MSWCFGFGDGGCRCCRPPHSTEWSRSHANCFGELVDAAAIGFDGYKVEAALFFFGNSIGNPTKIEIRMGFSARSLFEVYLVIIGLIRAAGIRAGRRQR